MTLPDLAAMPAHRTAASTAVRDPIILDKMDYIQARAVPGAIYSPEHKSMILPVPTARAAIVALALKPALANDHPELVELRDTLIQDIHPVDHATRLQIHVEAPVVHQTLLDDGHDWLEFDHAVNEPIDGHWPNQSTDLGYGAAVLEKHGAVELGWARGNGKTLGTCAIVEANDYKSVLVASPNTAKYDVWLRELHHRLPSHQVLVLGNTPAKRASALTRAQALHKAGTPFVLVVHHESLALVAGKKPRASGKGVTILNGWSQLKIKWDLFAFDESHRLKNGGRDGSQLHRAACKVPAEHRLSLTGSTYENNWEEPFGRLHWLFPKRYRSAWEDWNLRFLDYVEGYGKICVGILPGREQAMREELGVFMLIREKVDRSEHRRVYVPLGAEQRRVYDELVEMMMADLGDGTFVTSEAGVVQLTRLRQVATGLELLSHKVADSSKLDAAVDLIRARPEDDYFVAAWYKASAYALRDRLAGVGIDAWVITGDVAMQQRAGIIQQTRDAVKQRPRPPVVLIGTIPTLGESANLQHLNHVIRLDRSFNPALNRQVIDRVDRTGQTREVRATDIIAEDTVDQMVVLPNLANKDAFRALVLGRAS